MGLDMNFYKKDYVELDEYFSSRNRELFYYLTEKCDLTYGNEEYGKFIKLTRPQVRKAIKWLSKENDNYIYNTVIAELNTALENKQDIYINANW